MTPSLYPIPKTVTFFKNYVSLLCVCLDTGAIPSWRSKNSAAIGLLPCGLWSLNLIIRLGGEHLYPLSHFANPGTATFPCTSWGIRFSASDCLPPHSSDPGLFIEGAACTFQLPSLPLSTPLSLSLPASLLLSLPPGLGSSPTPHQVPRVQGFIHLLEQSFLQPAILHVEALATRAKLSKLKRKVGVVPTLRPPA